MLEEVARAASARAGIIPCHDFGSVHTGKIGYTDCEVRLSIETWQDAWYLRIMAIHSRGRSFRRTRVVKWAYSLEGPHDLAATIEEFELLAKFPPAVSLQDRRGPLGRMFDRLIRRRHYGRYDLKSPIDVQPPVDVSVEINAFGGGPDISFCARTRSQGFILAQMPHDAVGAILRVLKDYRKRS
ncbi:MAG: hypothetical protein KF810_01250 [Rhizobiaceae bacterium]|nr:hypothetical protein [Rhizobiaceae bacterium]